MHRSVTSAASCTRGLTGLQPALEVDMTAAEPLVDLICRVSSSLHDQRRSCPPTFLDGRTSTYRQLTPMARRQFFVSMIQPDLEYAPSATIPFMPTGQQDRLKLLAFWRKAVSCMAGAQPQHDVSPLIRNLKLTHLTHRWSLKLVTTIRRYHQQSAPVLLLEKPSFHEHQHGTRGRRQGDFSYRPFQPASLAGCISFTNRAPLLWSMLPGWCKPPVPCWFLRKKFYPSLTLLS